MNMYMYVCMYVCTLYVYTVSTIYIEMHAGISGYDPYGTAHHSLAAGL